MSNKLKILVTTLSVAGIATLLLSAVAMLKVSRLMSTYLNDRGWDDDYDDDDYDDYDDFDEDLDDE